MARRTNTDAEKPPAGSGQAAGPDTTLWAWYGLGVLLMTTLFAFVVRQMLSLVAPSLQTSLGLTDLQIGMLQGLGMAIFASVASYPMGWLADRFGRRLILALGVACWSLATALSAFQYSFSGLFVATIGIAIGEAGLAPIVFALIPDLFPERQRHTANFIFYGGTLLGAGLGMALGGAMLQWLAHAHTALPDWLAHLDTWRLAMLAIALPGPLFFLLVLTMPLDRTGADAGEEPQAGDTMPLDFALYAKTHSHTLLTVFGSIFAMAVAMTSGVMWFPLALPRAFDVDAAAVGIGLGTAITVATLIGVVLAPLALRIRGIGDDLEPVRVAGFFVMLTPLPAALLPFTTSPFQAYCVAALQGGLGIAASSLMPGVLQNLAPAHLRSRVLALLGITNALALAASPLAIGASSGLMTGPRAMMLAITIVSLPALILSAILIALAPAPYAATLRAVRRDVSEEG